MEVLKVWDVAVAIWRSTSLKQQHLVLFRQRCCQWASSRAPADNDVVIRLMLDFGETACLPEGREIRCGGMVSSCKFKCLVLSPEAAWFQVSFLLLSWYMRMSQRGYAKLFIRFVPVIILQVAKSRCIFSRFHTLFFQPFTWKWRFLLYHYMLKILTMMECHFRTKETISKSECRIIRNRWQVAFVIYECSQNV